MSSASKVTALYFVQSGCPACAGDALPQACAVQRLFADVDVKLVQAPGEEAYVADLATVVDDELFRRYSVQATPTLVLLDRAGRLRRRTAGMVPDLMLGAELMSLMRELS